MSPDVGRNPKKCPSGKGQDNMTMEITREALLSNLKTEGIEVSTETTTENLLNLSKKISNATTSQAKFASWLINVTQGNITNDQLTEALAEAFPTAKVGPRHGPHYASLSRSGKLKGCNYSVAKAGRSTSASKNELKELRALVESIRDAKNIKDVRAIMLAHDAK